MPEHIPWLCKWWKHKLQFSHYGHPESDYPGKKFYYCKRCGRIIDGKDKR